MIIYSNHIDEAPVELDYSYMPQDNEGKLLVRQFPEGLKALPHEFLPQDLKAYCQKGRS